MSESNGNGKHETPGGSGGKSDRTDSGRTEIQDQRLLSRAITAGWMGRRWATQITGNELIALAMTRELTAREMAMGTVMRDLSLPDPRPSQIAVGNLIRMEAQNQADEHKLTPDQVNHDHIHITADDSRNRLAAIAAQISARRSGSVVIDAAGGNGHTNGNGSSGGNGKPRGESG